MQEEITQDNTSNDISAETSQTEVSAQTEAPKESQPQEASAQTEKSQTSEQKSTRRTNLDRIGELESKIARMEAMYKLQGQKVVDIEVCTDLLLKGYTLEELKRSKPYLFEQQGSVCQSGVVKQPPKVVAEVQPPKQSQPSSAQNSFVKSLADMLISKF